MICPSTTVSGAPCTNTCQHGMEFCASHNPDLKRIRTAAKKRRERAYYDGNIMEIDRHIAELKAKRAVLVKAAKRERSR